MSIGRRRPKLSRATCARPTRVCSRRVDSPSSVPAPPCSLWWRCPWWRARRSCTDPGLPSPTGSAQRPDRELRVNVKEFKLRNQTKTSNERQAAADQVPPSLINDPGPIRELAERLDDLTTAVAKSSSIRRPARERPGSLEAEARELSRPQGGHRHSRAARQPARSDRRRVRALAPRRRARARHLAAQRGIEPAAVDPQGGRAAEPGRGWCRAIASSPNGSSSPMGPVYQEFCSAFTPPRVGQILFGLIADQLDSDGDAVLRGRGDRPASRRGAEPRPRPLRHLHPRRGPGRAGPDDRRGAAHPAPPRARRRHGRARFRRPGSPRRSGSSRWSPRFTS